MKDGFTLIELAIVLAVIAIVGAVILPSFLSTTDRARLKSDIQSARVLQNAADLHDVEQSIPLPRTNVAGDIATLIAAGYLPTDTGVIQTAGAAWEYDADDRIRVNISQCDDKVKALVNGLDTQEQAIISGK